MHSACSFSHFHFTVPLQLISALFPAAFILTLPSRPCRCRFNVAASSAVIRFLVMCQRRMTCDQMLFFAAQKKKGPRGGRGPYYVSVEAAMTR